MQVPKETKKHHQIHCLVRQELAILTANIIFLNMGESILLFCLSFSCP